MEDDQDEVAEGLLSRVARSVHLGVLVLLFGTTLWLYGVAFKTKMNWSVDPSLTGLNDGKELMVPVPAAVVIILATVELLDLFLRLVIYFLSPDLAKGANFKLVLTIVELAIGMTLIVFAVRSFGFLRDGNSAELQEVLRQKWEHTSESRASQICLLQDEFQCAGFNAGDCNNGGNDMCPDCIEMPSADLPGCFSTIVGAYQNAYLKFGVPCAVVAGLLLLDILLLWIPYLPVGRSTLEQAAEEKHAPTV